MSGRLDRILIVISATLAACGGFARPEPPSAREAECMLTQPPDAAAEDGARPRVPMDPPPVVVRVDQPIDVARAPRPVNAAERVVFGQVYETLVRVDCNGSVIAGLAESWRRADGGRGWTFTLRPGARFHDGSPVTARAVGESLAATGPTSARRKAPYGRRAERVAAVTVLSDRVLRVELMDSTDDEARDAASFASPSLAVGKAAPDGWPVGSGPYEIADATSAASTGENAAELQPVRPAEPMRPPAVVGGGARLPLAFRFTSGDDPRNALDAGVDVLVTADPDAIDYALARGSYVTALLPWEGVYVLFTPIGSDDEVGPAGAPPAFLLDELARDAVPGDARASTLDAPWACPASRTGTARTRRRPRIAFIAGDRAAAGLAERLVARAPTDRAGWIGDAVPTARVARLTAAPLSAAELAASLRAGADAAYVVRLDLNAPRPCPESSGHARLQAIPLVDTRKTAILRRGLEGVTVDGAGTLHFASAWRRAMTETGR